MGRKLDVDALANGVGFPQNADIGQSVLTGPSGVLVIMSGSTFAVSLRVMGVMTKVKKELLRILMVHSSVLSGKVPNSMKLVIELYDLFAAEL